MVGCYGESLFRRDRQTHASYGHLCGADIRIQETNLKGLFLTSQHFLGLLPSAPSELTTPNPTIIDVSSGFAVLPPVPGFSTNAISKLAGVQLCAYIAAEHPEVTVVALHPGIVHTNIVDTAFSWAKHMALDSKSMTADATLGEQLDSC